MFQSDETFSKNTNNLLQVYQNKHLTLDHQLVLHHFPREIATTGSAAATTFGVDQKGSPELRETGRGSLLHLISVDR